MTSIKELTEQIATLQQQMTQLAKGPTRLPIEDKLHIVYNPHNVQVWCSKVDCPHLGRETKVEIVLQPVDEELAKVLTAEGEDIPENIEVQVLRVSEPRKSTHPLGILAVFGTETEASKYVTDYYKRHRYDGETDDLNLCITEIDIV